MTELAKYACLLGELPPKLHAALEYIGAIDHRRGPSVVITDKVTGRYVQLYGGFGKPFVLDMPVGSGNPNEPFAERVAEHFGPAKYHFAGLAIYQRSFSLSAVATAKACLVLNQVFDLPTTAELEVEEILCGMAEYSKDATS